MEDRAMEALPVPSAIPIIGVSPNSSTPPPAASPGGNGSGSELPAVRPLPVNPDNIPARFKARKQWALKRGKVPYRPNGKKASSTDESTWSTYEAVWAAYVTGKWDGLYYAMTPADGVGIDED